MKNLYPHLHWLNIFIAATFLITVPHKKGFAQQDPSLEEGILRIKVTEAMASQLENAILSKTSDNTLVTGIFALDRFNRQYRVSGMKRLFPDAGKFEARHRKYGFHRWYVINIEKGMSVLQAVMSYQSLIQIEKAEPVYKKALIGSSNKNFGPLVKAGDLKVAASTLPDASNDPMLSSQWHYHNTGQTGGTPGADIRLFEAWKIETGNKNVIVAVTDGGIQTDHPDLAANIWVNEGEISGNNLDDDHNGYVDDIHGYSFVNNTGNLTGDDHGTHVAGTIAAVNNNGKGVAGIAGGSGKGDGVRLMSCAVFGNNAAPAGFPESYIYAADNGAVISQNSWGYLFPGVFEHVVLEVIDYFIAEAGKDENGNQVGPMKGGIVIFAAGNSNDEAGYYPAFYEPVLAVASSTHRDIKALYSNYGSWVDISAPGGETYESETQGVISTLTGSQYGSFMGTSMACPHISGVAALIVSKFGKAGFRPEALRERLRHSVDNIDPINSGYKGKLGTGRLNAALALAQGDRSAPQPIHDLSVSGIDVGEITLTWTTPQDESGFICDYDIRYSTSPVTSSNFIKATKCPDTPAPKPSGTKETITIKGLPGGVVYYFAVKAMDFEGNRSPISNVINETAAHTPFMVVNPASVKEKLKTAETSTRTFTIANKGKGTLKFTLEDSTSEKSFASVAPTQGVVLPGKEQRVVVTFDSHTLFAGTYRKEITILNNDPKQNTTVIPLTLQVSNNKAPIASVHPSDINFKSVQTGTSLSRKVTIANAGSDPLIISQVVSTNAVFRTVFSEAIRIDAFADTTLALTYSPELTGRATGRISIHTNDPANRVLTIQVQGEGLNEPPVVVSPDSFEVTLPRGLKDTRTLVMRNNGSYDRAFRLQMVNTGLVAEENTKSVVNQNGRVATGPDTLASRMALIRKKRVERLSEKSPGTTVLLKAVGPRQANTYSNNGRSSKTVTSETQKYVTGFEDFSLGPVSEQQGWFSTQGWTISSDNPDQGDQHFRGTATASGQGESFALSPYIFEPEEYEFPQYTSASMRINLDNGRGVTWQIVPQDEYFVSTRIRFNPDGSIEAMVIDNDYEVHWKKAAVTTPSGYFDLAIEYNNQGSDTSGFPTYYLFINNEMVLAGTGPGFGIAQVAIVSSMETTGPTLDIDGLSVIANEFIPPFVKPSPQGGILPAGESLEVSLEFDASVLRSGNYASSLLIQLDETDSIVVPAALTVTTATGKIQREVWTGIQGNDIGKIPTNTMPREVSELTRFEAPSNTGDHYGSRIRGYLWVPVTGDYYFWIASNDNSALWLSTDDKVKNKVKIAHVAANTNVRQWNKYASQRSTAIHLVAGQKYYIEALHKEGVGTDHIAVGWQLPDGALERPIPGSRLIPFAGPVTAEEDACMASGTIAREYWTGIPGAQVSSIPANTPPSGTDQLTIFEGPSDAGTNYGARISGYLCPPATGIYTFWISGNDQAELWLSADDSPNNKIKIAFNNRATGLREWNKFTTQRSAGISLVKGKKYYIEALHKQGVGSGNIAVGWQLPDGVLERPLPGSRLSPFETLEAPANARAGTNPPAEDKVEDPPGIDITVFPNPVHQGTVTLALEGYAGMEKTSNEVYLDIRTITGMSVYSNTLSCNDACTTEIAVDENFPAGVYIILVILDHKTFTEKLVVGGR